MACGAVLRCALLVMELGITRIFDVPVIVGGIVTVRVPIREPVQVHHAGLVSDRIGSDGQPMILHNSHAYKRVLETTATDFCKRQTGPLRFWGYPSKVPTDEVLKRARAQLGRKWRLVDYNCEHFATGAHGLDPTSPQLRDGITSAAIATGFFAVLTAVALVPFHRGMESRPHSKGYPWLPRNDNEPRAHGA